MALLSRGHLIPKWPDLASGPHLSMGEYGSGTCGHPRPGAARRGGAPKRDNCLTEESCGVLGPLVSESDRPSPVGSQAGTAPTVLGDPVTERRTAGRDSNTGRLIPEPGCVGSPKRGRVGTYGESPGGRPRHCAMFLKASPEISSHVPDVGRHAAPRNSRLS